MKKPLYQIKNRCKRKKNDSSINSGLSIQGMWVRYIGSLIGPQDWREPEKNVRFFSRGPIDAYPGLNEGVLGVLLLGLIDDLMISEDSPILSEYLR